MESSNFIIKVSDAFSQTLEKVTLTINEYDHLDQLTKGELIQYHEILNAMFGLLLPGIPIVIIGMICFYRREFGLVVRR